MHAISKGVLILLNLAFIVGGGLLIYLGASIRGGHWNNVYESGPSVTDANSAASIVIGLGAIIVLIAFFGFAGAVCKNRCFLTLYSIFVVIALLIFLLIGILGFVAAGGAKSWAAKAYPASDGEVKVAGGFNEAYCYAQAARFCTAATAKEALAALLPSSGAAIASVASTGGVSVTEPTGIVGFCKSVDAKASTLAPLLPSEYKKACAACKDVSKYDEYKDILDWANDKCPINAVTSVWCGNFILTNTPGDVYVGAPYMQCRDPILDIWRRIGNNVGIGGIVLTVVALVLVVMACRIAREPRDGIA
ncbi:Aste57867_1627 [Aphanomyces stellatus]|uniref:Aste57867_1627 protein n=1 Tax=Aphanomyces stellatus TaxID=120398 RepID=A0A485K6W3_9STRA|nr:hypothetical protein As57867_001625 [Aphanomyces stellatus]VFT78840.1 Aste57867_1627 [Aphanomyces stellatus]